MNAIELSHVTKHFPGFTLQDLSLTVPSGTICGLVGENGAGKSTTIRLLMGALRPDSGTCTVLGADSAAPEFLSLKEDIGVVLDEAYFPESLNALQVGGVMAKTYRRWDGKQYQNYLTRFGLPEKKPFKDFSRGMKMKLAIAVALSHSPRLLVLDEATAGLDPIVRDARTGELLGDATSCSMCRRLVINAGLKEVVIRRTATAFDVVDVADWVAEDDLLASRDADAILDRQ